MKSLVIENSTAKGTVAVARGEEIIERRLANARRELEQAPQYRFQVINDDLDRAVEEIVNIISSWRK